MEENKIEEVIQKKMNGESTKDLLLMAQALLIAVFIVHPFLKVAWLVIAGIHLMTYLKNRKRMKAVVKIINVATSDLPLEIKEKLKDVDAIMKDFLKSKVKKCDDPHCPNCWGLAGKDEPKI